MLERLGKVLGWIGNSIALLIVLGTVLITIVGVFNEGEVNYSVALIFIIVGGFIFLIGRALRYILAGHSQGN